MRSSHVGNAGNRSATLAHPISTQSLVQVFGVPCDPPPTIEFTNVCELPDNVNDLDRLLATSKKIFFMRSQSICYLQLT